MGRRRRSTDDDDYDDEDDSEGSDEFDDGQNWAGGTGFDLGSEAHKWKSTRRLLCWPLYSESVTITQTEIHIKRNECPVLPRECRPFRGWAVAPLRNIKSYWMRKTTTRPRDLFILFIVSVVLGLVGGGIISATAITQQQTALQGLETVSATLGFSLDASFFLFSLIVGVAACCLGCLVLTLRSPLRLVINVEGGTGLEEFSLDLIPGRVQPEEIKAKIDEVLAGGGGMQQPGMV